MINLLKQCTLSSEHPIYHPEKYLGRHIALVTLKALLVTKNVNLVFAALLHDICKPLPGEMKVLPEGSYWSNNNHDKEAEELIRSNDDIRYLIKSRGGDYDLVAQICGAHMKCKEKVNKKCKHIPFIDVFPILDDMVGRKEIDLKDFEGFILGLGDVKCKHITSIGQSPILRGTEYFSICIDRTPFRYKFSEIPSFFVGEWEWVQEYLKVLV